MINDKDMINRKPNIIFVFADQMRASALGCMGVEPVSTPHLNQFAREGTLFTRAVSNHPVCCPARATIMTGLHSINHGLVSNDQQLRTDLPFLAQSLNKAGYRCGYIGKWHMDCLDRGAFIPRGIRRRGFDDFWAVCNCNHQYLNSYYYLNDDPEPVWIDGYEPVAQTDLAVDYIRKKSNGEDPFCLFLSWGAPHCPYGQVPDNYLDMYPPEDIVLKPNAARDADKKVISGYYAHITALDECFGRVLKAVDEGGHGDNTIIIFTSDHGDMLFSQNRGWKMKPWAESVQIPFIVRWPGKVPCNRRSAAPIGLVDVMPTILGLVKTRGFEIDAPEMDGKDLAQLLLGDETAAPDSQYIYCPIVYKNYSYSEWRGVVTRTHTYARLADREWLLFNDREDPHQLVNLIDNKEASDVRIELNECLQEWLDITNDKFLSSEEFTRDYVTNKIINSDDKDELIRQIRGEYKKIGSVLCELPDALRKKYMRRADNASVEQFTSNFVYAPDDDLVIKFFENPKILLGKAGIGRKRFHTDIIKQLN